MAVTRLKRKAKRNKSRAASRQADIKRLTQKPVLKTVDVEAVKAEFEKGTKSSKKEKKSEEKKTEDKKSEE